MFSGLRAETGQWALAKTKQQKKRGKKSKLMHRFEQSFKLTLQLYHCVCLCAFFQLIKTSSFFCCFVLFIICIRSGFCWIACNGVVVLIQQIYIFRAKTVSREKKNFGSINLSYNFMTTTEKGEKENSDLKKNFDDFRWISRATTTTLSNIGQMKWIPFSYTQHTCDIRLAIAKSNRNVLLFCGFCTV